MWMDSSRGNEILLRTQTGPMMRTTTEKKSMIV